MHGNTQLKSSKIVIALQNLSVFGNVIELKPFACSDWPIWGAEDRNNLLQMGSYFEYYYLCISKNEVEQNRIQKGGHWVTRALWPWLIDCAAHELIHTAVLHLEHSAVSCWQRFLQNYVVSYSDNPCHFILKWPKPQSQRMCQAVLMPACISHTQDCLPVPF
jgi:hypothetical protein